MTMVLSDSTQSGYLDLGLIARMLPRLKRLTTYLPDKFDGSLQELSELESLNLRRGGIHWLQEVSNSVLPLESAKTLPHLIVELFAPDDDFTLHNFINIRHFITDVRLSIDLEDRDSYVELFSNSLWSQCSEIVHPSMDWIYPAESRHSQALLDGLDVCRIGRMDTKSMYIHGFGPQIPSWMDLDWISIKIHVDGFWIYP
jgi:hypothetical protein